MFSVEAVPIEFEPKILPQCIYLPSASIFQNKTKKIIKNAEIENINIITQQKLQNQYYRSIGIIHYEK
jgi:hypothetical protein